MYGYLFVAVSFLAGKYRLISAWKRRRDPFNKNSFRAEVRKFRGDEWIATATGLLPFLSQTEFLLNLKMTDVVLLVSELDGDFDFLNGIVEDNGIKCLLRTN